MSERQQVLYLWLANSALDAPTVGWAFHDGTEHPKTGESALKLPDSEPPYDNGVAALQDGWMLLQSSQLVAQADPSATGNDYLQYEFVFERRVG